MSNCKHNEEDLAKMCEVAVILSNYKTECEDLHDFFSDHVKPLFEAWHNSTGAGVYAVKNQDEEGYISEFANRVAAELYKRK